jgi:molybdate transport system substrate-binding protein
MNPGRIPEADVSSHKATNAAPTRHIRQRRSAQGHKRVLLLALAVVLGSLLSACGGGTHPTAHDDAAAGSSSGTITVLAAASLTEAFTQIGKDFEAKNPGSTVSFSFGSSATLATQLEQGAPADAFAAASPATMKIVSDAGVANPPTNFASNTLQIAVVKGNPHKIKGLDDFADGGKRIAVCAPQVPCGSAAIKIFAAAKIVPKPDTLEQDVKAVLQKVSSDEVDAGLVYKTDVIAAADTVDGIGFPHAQQAVNSYPIAALKDSKNAAGAQAFVDYVLSPEGQAVLERAGFAKP